MPDSDWGPSEVPDEFEELVRQTMRAHDHEAPTAAGLDPLLRASRTRRHRGWLAVAAAACVLAVVGMAVALRPSDEGHHAAAPALGSAAPSSAPASVAPSQDRQTGSGNRGSGALPMQCPDRSGEKLTGGFSPSTTGYWTPDQPSAALVEAHRLVPNRVPGGAVVCAYLHKDAGTLTGARAVTGDLAQIRSQLTWLGPPEGYFPPSTWTACATDYLLTDADFYLIGLQYGGHALWLSVPGNHCQGASNSQFVTSLNIEGLAAAAYASGSWPPRQDPYAGSSCALAWPGRTGQDQTMVPGDPVSATICRGGRHGAFSTPHTPGTATVRELVVALNGLPQLRVTGLCGPLSKSYRNSDAYRVRFDYAEGPSVSVVIAPNSGCVREVGNGNLFARATPELLAQVAGAWQS